MVNKYTVWLPFLLNVAAFASSEIPCIDKLTRNLTESSTHFQLPINAYYWKSNTKELDPDFSREAVEMVVKNRAYCVDGEVQYVGTAVCGEIIPGKIDTRTCLNDSNLGSFMVTRDNFDNLNVLFNKAKSGNSP